MKLMMLFSTGTRLERVGVVGPDLDCWAAGSWIVEAEVRLLQCGSTGSGRGTPLQEEQERRGVGEGFAHGCFDA